MQSLFNAAGVEVPQYVAPTFGYDAIQANPPQGNIEVSSKRSKMLPIVAILLIVLIAAFLANKKFQFVDTDKLKKDLPKYKKMATEYMGKLFSGGKKGKAKKSGK